MNGENLYKYYYSVDCNGFPVTKSKLVTRQEFISITGVDPVTNKCIF